MSELSKRLRDHATSGEVCGSISADLLAAAELLEAGEWREIESAPKDGWFLIYSKCFGVKVGRHSEDRDYDWEFLEERFAGHKTHHMNAVNAEDVTHWRPLPAPPEVKP